MSKYIRQYCASPSSNRGTGAYVIYVNIQQHLAFNIFYSKIFLFLLHALYTVTEAEVLQVLTGSDSTSAALLVVCTDQTAKAFLEKILSQNKNPVPFESLVPTNKLQD